MNKIVQFAAIPTNGDEEKLKLSSLFFFLFDFIELKCWIIVFKEDIDDAFVFFISSAYFIGAFIFNILLLDEPGTCNDINCKINMAISSSIDTDVNDFLEKSLNFSNISENITLIIDNISNAIIHTSLICSLLIFWSLFWKLNAFCVVLFEDKAIDSDDWINDNYFEAIFNMRFLQSLNILAIFFSVASNIFCKHNKPATIFSGSSSFNIWVIAG